MGSIPYAEALGCYSSHNFVLYICKSDQFHPNPTWVILLRSASTDVKRVASIWKLMMNPTNINMEDISNVFIDTISWYFDANMRYFNAQQLMVFRREEEQAIDCALCDDWNLRTTNPTFTDLRHWWIKEDLFVGVAEHVGEPAVTAAPLTWPSNGTSKLHRCPWTRPFRPLVCFYINKVLLWLNMTPGAVLCFFFWSSLYGWPCAACQGLINQSLNIRIKHDDGGSWDEVCVFIPFSPSMVEASTL